MSEETKTERYENFEKRLSDVAGDDGAKRLHTQLGTLITRQDKDATPHAKRQQYEAVVTLPLLSGPCQLDSRRADCYDPCFAA